MQHRVMRELFEIMSKDIQSESFTRREVIVYGIIAPLALVGLCGFAEWLCGLW